MKIPASIPHRMTRFAYISLLLLIQLAFFSCDDEKLESSTVRFRGTIQNADFSFASNTKFRILIRTNPNFDPDTAIAVRLSLSTNVSGEYDTTVHSDGFPAIPFYTISPIPDSLVSLDMTTCPLQPFYQQIIPGMDAVMNTRFGAATFINIMFRKTEESTATSLRFSNCTETISTSMEKPNATYMRRLPYEATTNPYPIFYTVLFSDFFQESRTTEAFLQPYDTTHVVIEY
jgi:hypothetical protein